MSKKYKLKYPFQGTGRQITEVEMRRPTVGDLDAMSEEPNNLKKSIVLVTLCGGLAPEETRMMDASDFNKLSKVVEGFLD